MTTPFVSHACEYETSVVLFLRPDLVDMDRVQQQGPRLANRWQNVEYGGPVRVFKRLQNLSAPGSMGSPQEGSPGRVSAF